jgi:transcriptional regulator with XRE-family HTH domain
MGCFCVHAKYSQILFCAATTFFLADRGLRYCYPVGMNRPYDTLRRIRQRLRQIHMTQNALARYLGLSPSNMSRRLSGQTPFTVTELAQLDSLLGLTSGVDDPAPRLFATALGALSAHDRREFLLLAASILEGKLQEPVRSQVCEALRILAG